MTSHGAAELIVSIFHSFKDRIADAISNLKLRNILLFMRNGHLSNIVIRCSVRSYHEQFDHLQ